MYHDRLRTLQQQGVAAKDALDSFGLKRYCCRVSVLCALDISDMYLMRHKPADEDVTRVVSVISGL
jgi:DNA-directed RNA polymerase subunit N (RpoN/RPB10)